jgi:hypothetical protein
VRIVLLKLRMKHGTKHRNAFLMQTAALVGMVAAAVVAKMTAPDIKRYVRIKTM